MNSSRSYFLILGIVILSIFTGIFIWSNQYHNEVPNKIEKSFTAPASSKYIPTNADIIFHWKINPNTLPKFIDNHQNKKIKLIRDSSLNLISLDFAKDISKWAGGHGSFVIFDTNNKPLDNWLMILEINKDINITEEFSSISELQFINENIELKNNLKTLNIKLFPKKIDSNKSIYFSNHQETILISPNPYLIKSSIYNFNSNILNKKQNYKNIKLKNQLKDGIILLEVSTKKVLNTMGQEKNILNINETEKLISSINFENKKLIFDGILSYNIKAKRPINELGYDLSHMVKEFISFDNSIFIDNPKQYFRKDSVYPYKNLISSIIQASTSKDYSKLFQIILENTQGNLIWLKDEEWLAITRKDDTDKKKIDNILEKDKFSDSLLDFRSKILEVWSKITTNSNENYEIKENIEAIIDENEDLYIWSQDLSYISNFDNQKYSLNRIDKDHKEIKNNDFDDVIRIHLGKEKTEIFLSNFYPYILLRTMLGNKLHFPENIDISVAIPAINYPDFVKFKIELKTG